MNAKVLIVSKNCMGTAIYGKLRTLSEINFWVISPESRLSHYKNYTFDLVVWINGNQEPSFGMMRNLFPGSLIVSIGPTEEIEDFPFEEILVLMKMKMGMSFKDIHN